MPRVMFDSTTPGAIPPNAEIVAGYVDGSYAWPASAWSRFPNAQHVMICVTGDHTKGDCLDVENGDATPDHAPGWIRARHAAGVKNVTIYCNRDTIPAIEAACAGLSYYKWIATLDGTLFVAGFPPLAGPAAVQFAGANLAGVNVDISLVWEDNWHAAPARVAAPAAGATMPAEAVSAAADVESGSGTAVSDAAAVESGAAEGVSAATGVEPGGAEAVSAAAGVQSGAASPPGRRAGLFRRKR
ncbi:MAG TPA: hypothetical protein VIX86_17075 [Streptosporangiaceae bacterium]